MNLSGILVVAEPERQEQVVSALNALEGVEVHQVDAASGRIVVVQEAEDIHAEIAGVKRIKALPHVIMAEMAYHYLAEDDRGYEAMPPELIEQQDGVCVPPAREQHPSRPPGGPSRSWDGPANDLSEPCAVPAYLND